MVRHMVMWKLKPESVATKEIADANFAKQLERFGSMKESIAEIKNLEVFRSFNTGVGFYDFVVIMDFESREDLLAFQSSPSHSDPEARKFGQMIRESKAVVDYEF